MPDDVKPIPVEVIRTAVERGWVFDQTGDVVLTPNDLADYALALRECVEFYADPDSYNVHQVGTRDVTAIETDGGQRARALLGEHEV